MKKYFVYLLLIFSVFTYSQEQVAGDKIYESSEIDVKPEFEGGIQMFYKYVMNNFEPPKQEGIDGKIFVEFVIEKTGEITNIKILKDVGFGSAENAIKLFKECPKWKPGKKNGELVRTRYKFPIKINT